MSERKHDKWKVAAPIRIDGAGDEVPRPCDLVVCPECLAVRYIGRAQLEDRVSEVRLFNDSKVRGVFCPGCDQMLFDEKGWIEHRAEQRQYDNEQKRLKEGGAKRSGPPEVAAAMDGNEEALELSLAASDYETKNDSTLAGAPA